MTDNVERARAGGEWWRGCAIYQIYPRSFQDSGEDGVGDLPGVTSRLPYVASLGVDAIWLSPFFMSPMADMGYDVSDYCAVDPLFGTLADFDDLVAEAHRLGLKVIIDQVLSHCSDQHVWFRESRSSRTNLKADWYVWADPKPDGNPPNNWLSVFGGPAWEWDSTRRQYYLHNFLASQPDLNFHNPDVRTALLDTVRFWLDRGVDGFRLDTVNYYFHNAELHSNPPKAPGGAGDVPDTNPYGYQQHIHDKNQPENLDFLREFRALLDQYDDRAAVGEVGDGAGALTIVAAYTGGGDMLHMCYTFDMLAPTFSAEHVAQCISEFETSVVDGWVCWAFSNHDVQRHATRWAGEGRTPDAIARFSIGLIACLRGSICLYQGEELGLPEADIAFEDLRDPYGIRFWPAFKGRDGCRTPMVWEGSAPFGGFSQARPWLPVPPAHLARSVDVQQADAGSILARYRNVLSFRKAQPALVGGTIEIVEQTDDVLAFLREADGERLLCVFNFAADPVEWTLPANLGPVETLSFPGSRAVFDGATLALEGLDGYCGRVV